MSDSKGIPEPAIKIASKAKQVPPTREDSVNINEGHAQLIAEFVSSPVFHVIRKVIVPQRKDQISRRALTESQNYEQVLFYRGEVYELNKFFQLLMAVKKDYDAQHSEKEERQFKK